MNHARRIAKNSVFQALAYGAQSLTSFIVPLYLARLAGAELLGQFATMITFAGLFASISIFGLPSLLIREIARKREDRAQTTRLINAALGLIVVLSVAATLLMIGAGAALGYSSVLVRALALTGTALGIESGVRLMQSSFRGIEEMEWSAAVIASMEVAFLALALVVIPFKVTIDALMAAYVASRVVSLVVGVMIYRARFGSLRLAIDRELWGSLLKACFPFAVNNGLSSVYVRIDVVFLSAMAGSAVVGLYEAANNLTMRVNILARTVNLSLYPFLSAEFVKDRR